MKSSFKALVYNKLGDIILLLAICIAFEVSKTIDLILGTTLIPQFKSISHYQVNIFNLISLSQLIAPFTKSASLPFSPWLTDAMAAPTPVSALLHAATMVTAGIFLLLRIALVLEMHLTQVASFGAFTILFGGRVALLASDVKQIVAYSTTSQLGQMFLSSGVSNHLGTIFHLFSHAFFKALLFLTAGGVIADSLMEQKYYILGGLNKVLPLHQIFTLTRSLSLLGYPSQAGFQSIDYTSTKGFIAILSKGFDTGPVIRMTRSLVLILPLLVIRQLVLPVLYQHEGIP